MITSLNSLVKYSLNRITDADKLNKFKLLMQGNQIAFDMTKGGYSLDANILLANAHYPEEMKLEFTVPEKRLLDVGHVSVKCQDIVQELDRQLVSNDCADDVIDSLWPQFVTKASVPK